MKTKLIAYTPSVGAITCSDARSVPRGGFNSKTMIVMITAMTPSLKASSRAESVENGAFIQAQTRCKQLLVAVKDTRLPLRLDFGIPLR